MLKKRCDPVAHSPLSSELTRHGNGGRPSSPLLLSPRSPSLQGFSPRGFFSVDASLSPTAMAEHAKSVPCGSPRNPLSRSCGGGPVAGLAGVLVDGEAEKGCCGSGRVLLGMRLRVQLPPEKGLGVGAGGELPPAPSSPIEFGVKNRDAQLALLSPVQRSPLSSAARAARSEVEELAEDYTCVIARGPNPKMTHIFDDRVVESCGAGSGDGGAGDACRLLASCYGCKKSKGALFLQHRDEKVFSSSQCRYREVLFDKRIDEASDVSFKMKH
ncbi:protein MARD1-like [Oryza brachyantha]|uniref:protein MARD1-like n=1 Tax=Oryza brachyantha TaxID=4533 RepID=UPI001ADCAF8E|nr:protein MARD1-like [Oryza brachyantha]